MSLISVVALVVLLASAAARGNGDKRRTWTGRSGGCVAVWIVAGPAWIIALLALPRVGPHPLVVTGLVLTTAVLFPWPIVRRVLVPLGLPRAAAAFARVADFTWGHDPQGGVATAAVLAASFRATLPPATGVRGLWRRVWQPWAGDIAFARARVQRLDLLGAGGVMAAALLADFDGDHRAGDALCETLDHFDPEVVPTVVRRLRAERAVWRLHADGTLTADARRARLLALDGAGSPTVALLQALARRDDDDSAMARARVAWAWLWAPRHRRTWSLVREPRHAPPARVDAPPADVEVPANFGAAATRHAQLMSRASVSLAEVVALAAAWEQATAAASAGVRARAATLGVPGDDVASSLEAGVRDSLVALARRLDLSSTSVRTLPSMLQVAVGEVRSERQDALEIAVTTWRQRLEDQGSAVGAAGSATVERAPVDELREWAALRSLAADVAKSGDDGDYVAYEASQWVTCELAVRLWNVRREHRLANAMFRSLLAHAERVSDTRGAETQRANVACGP